uniref:uncharacterized protein prob1 n=1 Tax=Scatophagus argus TaxID=75038 RepID=UPI001ED7DA3D|nr:uncharacterized protein prob1 [Scatophagus argus]
MSAGLDGGGRGGRKFFLSSHRCPEVELLPHHNSETQIPPVKNPEITCKGQSVANYLDVSSSRGSEGEEEDGSISEWSEEDLSLHFSPSVILPSDDEESDPESSFECVDITVDTQVKGREEKGLKMVPKRQIQLKKKDAEDIIEKENLQVLLKDRPPEGTVANSEVSANELLCPIVRHRPDLLLRQHSMPASLHAHSETSGDVDSCGVYRGLVAGASQGFHIGGNSRQRLQKSFSLDETKTKMASCIIKSVLSKKMQAEENNSKTSYLQRKPVVLPNLPQPADQQRVREGGGGKTGGGVTKAPTHVVRDMRSLVKNTYSLSFSTAPTTTPENNKTASFKVMGQEGSPPPTYQQAVGVKGHDETKRSFQTAVYRHSLNRSQDKSQSSRFSCPVTQQRRGSEPVLNRSKVDDVTWPGMSLDPPTDSPVNTDPSELNHSQSERAGGESRQEGTSFTHSALIQPPPLPPSTSKHLKGTHHLLSVQEQNSILGVSSQLAPSTSQQILHSCFYTPTALPTFPPSLHPQVGKVRYMHSPVSYIQTQQAPPPAPTFHLLRRTEENQSSSTGNTSDQHDHFTRTCSPQQTRTRGDQESNSNTETPATQEQHEQQKQQQQFLCNIQGFLPAQVGSDLLVGMTGSTAGPGALLSGPGHIMLDPQNGQCFYVDTPPKPQRKMLLDPETGQYVQVFLPASSSTPNNNVFSGRFVNPAPFAQSVINPVPTVLSVMQFQPAVAVSSLYAPPCLPFTLHTPSANFAHTAP